MNRLIRFALAFSPREFRRNFQSDVSYDAEHGSRPVVLEALDIIASGIALHLEGAWRNLSLGARALNRSRLYAFVSVLTIALAIGANITVASTIQGVLLDPLPYPDASNLYYASKHGPYGGWSYLNAHDYLARSTTVADLGIAGPDTNTLLGRGASVRLDGRQVDGGYFRVLGAHALIGRLITAADMTRRVVVLSNDVWRANFGADPGIVGRRIDLGQTFYLVIGVMAPTFRDPGYGSLSRAAFWIPDDRFARSVRVRGDSEAFVRLRPGVSVGAAQADLRRVITQLDREYPNPAQQNGVPPELVALIDRVVGDVRPLLWLLYGAVAVLLLVALANIANLALVRAAARESELAVRSALGAGRRQIAGQLAAESAIVALAGGIAGVAGALVALKSFAVFGNDILPRWESVHIGTATAFYAGSLVIAATIISGLLPVLWVRSETVSRTRGGSRPFRAVLVGTEIALALAVVIAAGLIVRSFVTLTHVSVGFDSSHLVYVSDVTPNSRMSTFAARIRTTHALLTGFRSIPGVAEAVAVESPPFGQCCIVVETNVPANSPRAFRSVFNSVSPNYFGVMRIPLLAGRRFTREDRIGTRPVAIVSRVFAVRYFGSVKNALGKTVFPQFNIDSPGKPITFLPRTIVGVVGDVRNSFSQSPIPQVYTAADQFPHFPSYVLRLNRAGDGIAAAVITAVRRVDPTIPPPAVAFSSTLLGQDALAADVAAVLFGAFAGIALVLALAGVYAVTAYSVEQRTREFGIRKAVGARDSDVTRNVLRGVAAFGAVGILAGLVLASLTTRLLAALLFQTSPLDLPTFVLAVALVAACTLLAALVPALRAMRVNPVIALRYE
jgi:putative ABC transport system permease protein